MTRKNGTRKKKEKKYFTLEEANATLPLLRSILRDITALANELRDRHQLLSRLQNSGNLDAPHREEVQELVAAFEAGQEKMKELEHELAGLGVELKDHYAGLIDFRARQNGREVYLCWKLDEPTVAHWHELDSGFKGRQKIVNRSEETVATDGR